uniref:Protein phosphatase 1 regulatory subunit 15A/B C-terminal domain-containing protein n=1 Tax=Oryzias latipes TaxID=8090 RepID=A0A3P9K3Q5_ORYLA
MFRSLNPDGPQSSASPAGPALSSMVLGSQESSWIGQLSRPALSLLQKLVPVRLRSSSLVESGSGWFGGESRSFVVPEENEFLRKLTDLMPLAQPHLSYLQCHHDGPGLVERGGPMGPHWFTPESLLEPDRPGGDRQSQTVLSSVRTFLNQVLLNSQELRPGGGMEGPSEPVSPALRSRPWWDSLLQDGEKSHGELWSEKSWHEEGAEASQLCLSPSAETKPHLFDHYSCREWMLGENTGPPYHKEELTHNGGLCIVQNPEGSAAGWQRCIKPFPNRVNGCSSLEEEYSQSPPHYLVRVSEDTAEEQPLVDTPESATAVTEMEESSSAEDKEEKQVCSEEEQSGGATEPSAPQCQNKAIAFIMGCPCSDDDSSQSDESSDEDDDGFDSEGSSDVSNSSDDEEEEGEDEDSDSEPDSDSEQLWTSMCQIADPYNPRNFTACLHTGRRQPQPIHTPTPPSSTQSSPEPSPDLTTLVPPSNLDSWDESTSASEVDEAESLRLLGSFSCSSDPFSLLNFQAPLRTRRPTGAPHKVKAKKPSESKPHPDPFTPASPPEYNKEEAEERMDSGFSERSGSSKTPSCRSSKKVRFCDTVEEFFANCEEEGEEDRQGPWEQMARDRCRFLRRCQEVEQQIAYCLQPQHRLRVYQRLKDS